jgi:hypothetical protein
MRRIETQHTGSDNPFLPAPWAPESPAERVLVLAFIATVCVGYAIILMGLFG